MPEENEGLHKEEKIDKQKVLDIVNLDNLEETNMHIKLIEKARKYRGEQGLQHVLALSRRSNKHNENRRCLQ